MSRKRTMSQRLDKYLTGREPKPAPVEKVLPADLYRDGLITRAEYAQALYDEGLITVSEAIKVAAGGPVNAPECGACEDSKALTVEIMSAGGHFVEGEVEVDCPYC